MRKWLLGYVFAVLCLGVFVLPCHAADATPPAIPTTGDVWDGSTEAPTKIVQKDGVNYYEITKCSQLAYVAQEGEEWLARNYILANNLILNDVVLEWDEEGNLLNNPSSLHEWTPIEGISGTFDGGGYVISGLCIDSDRSDVGLFSANEGSIKALTIVNAFIRARYFDSYQQTYVYQSYVGGIAGFSLSGQIADCVFSGMIIGGSSVGGICGSGGNPIRCTNYGVVIGKGAVGGVCGRGFTTDCTNYGTVTGEDYVGGVCGSHNAARCANYGTVIGGTNVGGICGNARSIENSYNAATVTGESNVGGIVGGMENGRITNCYNIGNVVCTSDNNNVGAIIGSDGALWDKDTIISCYYLKSNTVNATLYGCGNVTASGVAEPSGFYAKSAAELKQQSTFVDWPFEDIYDRWGYREQEKAWSISPTLNGGYPYLAWQDVSDIPLTGLTFTQSSLSLGVGDTAYLTANPQPATAALPPLVWSSRNTAVAEVNQNGHVIAVGAGTTTITASGGGFTATCTVTVSARSAEEYRLGALTVRDTNGAALASIPRGSFLVTIPVTKQAEGGGALVMLASYSASGQFKGLLYVAVKNAPVGTTVEVTLPVDNADGTIAQLKAFAIASFGSPIPLGTARTFPG